MDYNSDDQTESQNVILMVHPDLSLRGKELIKTIGARLGYQSIYDFSHEFDSIIQSHQLHTIRAFLPWLNRTEVARKNKKIASLIQSIKEKIYSDGREFDEIYCRDVTLIESLIIEAIIPTKKLYTIEDGIGDYRRKDEPRVRVRRFELKAKSLTSFLFKLANGYRPKYIKCYLKKKYNISAKYSNFSHKKNIVTADYFKKNIGKLSEKTVYNPSRKIVIIGSLLGDIEKVNMSLEAETAFYNRVIPIISERHKVALSDIWYKPHPRSSFKAWEYKNNNLLCQTYDFEENPLFEQEINSPHLMGVYSVGSSSLLYAKEIFNIPSFLIDMRSYRLHPLVFDMYYEICDRFNIEVIKV